MGVTVKVLANRLPDLPGKVRSRSGQITQQSADRIVKRAKELVPVDTGELQANISAIKTGPFSWVVSSSRPSTDDSFDVASFIEFKRQAYLRPAVEEERNVFLDAIDGLLDGVL